MTYAGMEAAAAERSLSVLGGFHPEPDDKAPTGCKTLLLLGPDEPSFWPVFQQSQEWRDGNPDPMDRWSTRVIGEWASTLDAQPLYPFGGAPFQPFYSWALRTGRIHSSPVQFLVHDKAGLFVSFRGALALSEKLDLPQTPQNPCGTCATQPCKTACLSGALTPDGYDVPACKAFLHQPEGHQNITTGCNVRRICPISEGFGRQPEQSAYHMRQFLGD